MSPAVAFAVLLAVAVPGQSQPLQFMPPTPPPPAAGCSFTALTTEGSCVDFKGLSSLPRGHAWAVRDSQLPRTCFVAAPCAKVHAAETNCSWFAPAVSGGSSQITVAPAFQQGEGTSGRCYALGNLSHAATSLIDPANLSKGLLLTYSGGAGGRSIRYRLICDASAPAEAGPTSEAQLASRSLTYEVTWRTPHACHAVPADPAACAPPPAPPHGPVAVPSPQQLAWQDLEVSAMLGFSA